MVIVSLFINKHLILRPVDLLNYQKWTDLNVVICICHLVVLLYARYCHCKNRNMSHFIWRMSFISMHGVHFYDYTYLLSIILFLNFIKLNFINEIHTWYSNNFCCCFWKNIKKLNDYSYPLTAHPVEPVNWTVCVIGFFTSPARAVAEYCDECICLCVCLSDRISPEPHTWSLPNFLCMLPVSMAWSSFGMFTIGRIAYRRVGIFFPIDIAL